ncbi:MAG: modification methylase [Firmicutes bacterium ML8_F2]|nr:MAG: modification methylase [Firmicutes bacterium ML8_F2]
MHIGLCNVLRYPGGKFKALESIVPIIPRGYREFREPFVGGGSVFLAAKQNISQQATYKIGDLSYDLCCFWRCIRDHNQEIYQRIKAIKNNYRDGRSLFTDLKNLSPKSDLDRAVRFFILNRITFSGVTDAGGYSEQSFRFRFTSASIEKIRYLEPVLKGVQIEHASYEKLLFEPGKDVFIFMDPPYYQQAKSKLYGIKGSLHTTFDHFLFAENVKKCRHQYLITLDDSPEIKKLFSFANVYEWELQYSMGSFGQRNLTKGRELFISSCRIPALERKQLSLLSYF